ncbi:unnamed protein product [Heterobilharzia americana]|nr:unnamed protein product [Heterobilharzia americana]
MQLVKGIRQSYSITYHGIAINCTTEPLLWLRQIIPCGLADRDVACLSEACGRQCTPKEVAPKISDCIVSSLFTSKTLARFSVNYQYRNDLEGNWCISARDSNSNCEDSRQAYGVDKSWSQAVDEILSCLQLCFTSCTVDNLIINNK